MTQGKDADAPQLAEGFQVARCKRAILPTAHSNGREDFSLDDQRHCDGVSDACQLFPEGRRQRRRIQRADHRLLLSNEWLKFRRGDWPAATGLRRWAAAIETDLDPDH